MDVEFFAHLHGLKAKKGPSPAKQTEDPELQQDISDYADLIIQEEKEGFEPGIESFSVYSNRLKQEISDSIHDFTNNYEAGYQAISDALALDGQKMPGVSEENLKIFSDPDALAKEIEEGKSIYELLGYNYETLIQFYQALNTLFEKQEYEKVREGFYFLITLSPETPEFWVGLAISSIKLKEYEKAENAYRESLELDPSSVEIYLGCLHVLVYQDKIAEANQICEQGIEYAEVYNKEDLKVQLVEALKLLKIKQG